MSGEQNLGHKKYDRLKVCPLCGGFMKYMFGEMYQCQGCGWKEYTDFGKVKNYLEKAGPQPAVIIARETGVELGVIDGFLKQGRVEIPDGSPIYIKCQSCGTDIRYGRFCPDCMLKMTKNISQAMLAPEVGEKPKNKANKTGKMHTLDAKDMLKLPNRKNRNQ